MYIQGHRAYEYHIKMFGHPSQFGHKDLIPLWKAERFDPEALVAIFKRAGAKYVVPVAVRHDNFDGGGGPGLCPGVCFRRTRPWFQATGEWRAEGSSLDDNFDPWNSMYQRWNAVNMGP